MLQEIARLDRELFIFLNSLHHPFLDPVMQAVSSKYFWVPFYLAIIGWVIYHFRRKAFLLLPMLVVNIALADSISSRFFKPFFGRLRPCHDFNLYGLIRFIDGCGGKFGFLSSHAANSFALASIMYLLLHPRLKRYRILFFAWAFLVSYSRIYLGVHYPADVLLGGLLGVVLGWLTYRAYKYFEDRYFTS